MWNYELRVQSSRSTLDIFLIQRLILKVKFVNNCCACLTQRKVCRSKTSAFYNNSLPYIITFLHNLLNIFVVYRNMFLLHSSSSSSTHYHLILFIIILHLFMYIIL